MIAFQKIITSPLFRPSQVNAACWWKKNRCANEWVMDFKCCFKCFSVGMINVDNLITPK